MARLQFAFPTWRQPAEVVFGSGCLKAVADGGALGDTAFFLSAHSQVRAYFTTVLRDRGVPFADGQMCIKPPGEPTVESVDRGAEFLRSRPYRRIVGIGGGSVLDWCRLAWAASCDLLTERGGTYSVPATDARRPELWLAPTTCATGAEGAGVAVFSAAGRKYPVVSRLFVADRVFLDARFLEFLSPGAMALSLCDAASHAVEAYVSIVPAYLAKEAAASALWRILDSYGQPRSTERDERLLEAAYLAGLAAGHCSVGVVHAFAHTTARQGIPHAQGNALGLLAGLAVNAHVPALAQLAGRMGCESVGRLTDRLRPIVADALAAGDQSAVVRMLSHEASRNKVAELMSWDACLRTNPRSLEAEDYRMFFDSVLQVARGTGAAC